MNGKKKREGSGVRVLNVAEISFSVETQKKTVRLCEKSIALEFIKVTRSKT